MAAVARKAAVILLGVLCVVRGYEVGKEYEYDYTGRTEFQIPFKEAHHTMMAFKSKVVFQKTDDLEFKVLIKDVEMGTYQDNRYDYEHSDDDHHKGHHHHGKISMEKSERVTEAVERPFILKAKLQDGNFKVDHIETPVGDPVWSINMKKALISFMTIFLPQSAEHTYTSVESTIQGDCQVYWNILHQPDHMNQEAKVMNVSRVVDHDSCKTIAGKIYGALRGNPCVNCESVNTHPLTMTSRAWYNLVTDGTRKKIVVEYAHGHSEIVHAPYTENGIVTNLVTNQYFTLRETREKSDMPISGDMEVHKDFNMVYNRDNTFNRVVDMKKANHFIHKDPATSTDTATTLLKELSHMHVDEKNNFDSGDEKDFALIYSKLMEEVSTFDYEQTEKLYNDVVKTADDETKPHLERLFVDLVASSGHNAGIQFLVDKFLAGELKSEYYGSFFHSINRGYKEPTATGLDTLLGFCNSDKLKDCTKRKTCLMTYTSLIAEYCRISLFAPPFADPVCLRQKLQTDTFAKLVPEYKVAKDQGDDAMDTYIHISTNLRTHGAVDFLVSAMKDETLDIFLRMDAVAGLVKTVPVHTNRFRSALADVYLDSTEPYELRIMAAVAIFKSNPPLSLLHAMVEKLHYETSDQLKTYVVSMFQEIDRNEHPCFKPIAQHVRYLIPKIIRDFKSEWARKDLLTSHMHLSASYDPHFDFGGHTIISMIMSENSYLPRELYIGGGDYFANFIYDNVGIRLRQSGFDKFTDMGADPKGRGKAFGTSLWNYFGKRRVARDAQNYHQEVEDIDTKLHLKTKAYEPLKLDFTVTAYGHDIVSMHLNETDILGMMPRDNMPDDEKYAWLVSDIDKHRMLNQRDLTFTVPTGFGMPASLYVRHPTVFSLSRKDSSLKVEKDGTIHLKLQRNLKAGSHLQESFRLDLPYDGLSMGVGMDHRVFANLPIKVDASMNCATGRMTHNRDFLMPRKVLSYEFQPFTFLTKTKDAEPHIIEFDSEEDMEHTYHKFNHTVLGDLLGVDVTATGMRLDRDMIPGEHKLWFYESDFRSKMYYMLTNPMWYARKLDISVKPADKDASTGRTLDISKKRSDPEQPQPPSKFEEYTGDLDKSYVQVLNIDSTLHGDKERKASMEFRYSFTPDRKQHWLQMFYERTPFSSKETHNTKACMGAKMTQTTTNWDKYSKDTLAGMNADQKMHVAVDLRYGKDCKTGPEVHANIHYEHSDEQKMWLEDLTKEDSQIENPYRKLYKRCLKNMEEGLTFSYKCHKFVVITSQLNKMTMDVGMDGVKLPQNPIFSTLYMKLKGRYNPYLQSYYNRPNETTPGRIHIESVSRTNCDKTREADITFAGPYHTSEWRGVPISRMAHWAPRTATHRAHTNMITYDHAYYHRYCDMQKNSMLSFDRKLYSVPDTKCFTVISKDCSPHKVFTVLAKNTEAGFKDVIVYVDGNKIEVAHSADGSNTVTINGAVVEIPQFSTKIVRNERGDELFTVTRKERLIIFDSNVYGLTVIAFKSSAVVQAANYYRGKLCGLCGDMNFDGQHEFHTTDGCHHHTGWSFARSFMIPDDTCAVPLPDPTAGAPICAK